MIYLYKDLIVWQRSIQLVIAIYELTDGFPREEIYGLTSQIRRATVAIPSNIAEGRFRGTRKDFLQFLRIAYSSGAELETQIEIVKQLRRTKNLDYSKVDALLLEVMKMLNSMIKKLNPLTKLTKLTKLKTNSGQSLVEVLIGLTIGVIIIGVAAFAIVGTLRANISIDRNQAALNLAQELSAKVRSFSGQSWQNIYGLTKGLGTQYFLNASGSTLFVVRGSDGVLDNDVTDGLIGEWKFDENVNSTSTTTYDATGNNNHGTLVNSPIRASSTCIIGNCFSFNGVNSYVNISATSTLNFSSNGNFTISVWVNPATLSSAWRRGIIVQENYLNSGYRFGFANGGQPIFWTTQSGGTLQLSSSQNLTLNQWTHIVITYNSQQAYMYVNGVQTASSTGTYISGSNSVSIGYAVNEYFSGLLDDVRIYNRALSADEVKQLYGSKIYTRSFSVENTCRSNDSSSTISGVSPCGGGSSDDPSTQKVSVITSWPSNGTTTQATLVDYLTRWQNAVFQQADWTGGVDASSIYTNTATTFSSSTNIATTTNGAIKLRGI